MYCVFVCLFECMDGVVCIVLGDSVARMLLCVLLSDTVFGLCVVGMRVTVWPLFTLLPWCCCLLLCLIGLSCWTCLGLLCC